MKEQRRTEGTMQYFTLEAITLGEFGSVESRSIAGRFNDRAEALAAAIDYAQELAGPVRDGYRRPTVSIVNHHQLGLSVKVGDASVDAEYTIVYPLENRVAPSLLPNGTGYIKSRV